MGVNLLCQIMTKQNYCFFLIYNEKASKKNKSPAIFISEIPKSPAIFISEIHKSPGIFWIIFVVGFSITYIGTMFPFEYGPIECTTTYRILLGFFCFLPPFFI